MRYSKSAGTKIVIGFVVLFCMLTTVLVAEISPVPKLHGFGWRKALPTHLLGNEAVRGEIRLTDELVQQVNNFRSELESESRDDQNVKRSQHAKEEFRKIVDDRMKENEIALRTNLMKVLTPEQKEKFDELKGPPFESLDRKHR
jgi:Spy/CpxP family protein refolding chaperone